MSASNQTNVCEECDKTVPSNNNGNKPSTPAKSRPAWTKALTIAAIVVVAAAGCVIGIRYWDYATTHVSTDNAMLTGDVVQISPQVSGTVESVFVKDNQMVKKGQLLVVLDDATYRANVQQAQANLEAAIAQAEGAGISVSLTGDTSSAQILQAEAGVAQSTDAIGSAEADVAQNEAAVQQARANAKSVEANVKTTEAQVDTARAGVRVAEAALAAAKAELGKYARDNKRYQELYSRGSASAQMADQAAVAEQTAQSQVDTAEQQVAASKAKLSEAQAGCQATKEQFASAKIGISQAEARLAASRKNARQAFARREQAHAQLSQANTAPKQVNLSKSSAKQAQARIEQAKAALETAKLQLSYTRIFAPVSGRVSKKTVQQGALMQAGTPLMAIVPPPPHNIWAVANFKETQTTHIRPGQSAEIEVDGFPGKAFKAHVDSVASATGATFALLPPDNATGNFTKVVQRIPVKLVIDKGQKNVDDLRAGMSVEVTIKTK
ncbi:MAG: biotin/lipoyl-binding protein [Armatimonadota bacterium]|nr:biotin/lipoyl-binding protein [bacterium]